MSQILIVEDEDLIAAFITKGLRAAGYSTVRATTGSEAIGFAVTDDIALIVLDIGLPDIDGFEVLRQLRGQGVRTPVIILTARSSVTDKVAGLDGGADDYMAKPFSFEELLARIRSRLRSEPAAPAGGTPNRLVHKDINLDLLTRRVSVEGREVDLSAREFSLAETFFRNPEQVLSREQLLSQVWGYDFDPASNVVDVYVRYLRKKIGAQYFETVRGMGYRLR